MITYYVHATSSKAVLDVVGPAQLDSRWMDPPLADGSVVAVVIHPNHSGLDMLLRAKGITVLPSAHSGVKLSDAHLKLVGEIGKPGDTTRDLALRIYETRHPDAMWHPDAH